MKRGSPLTLRQMGLVPAGPKAAAIYDFKVGDIV